VSSEGPAAPSASARSLLLTLLGEFVYPSKEPVWTSTLVQAFAAVGIAEKAARQTLARAAAAGWIEGGKQGRHAWWAMTPQITRLISEGSQRVRALRHAAQEWPGGWLVLHITLPESRRADRLKLYRVLQWMGFGSPSPGLWVCPHQDRAVAVEQRVKQLGLERDTLAFTAHSLPFGMQQPELTQRAWDIEALAAYYRRLDDQFGALRPRSEEAVFIAHVQLVNALQRLPAVDPGLPAALLPRHWDGERVTRRLEELRARWRDAAHTHWQRLCEGF
jgi:phenylacetic acid degradation operon negative regulatory protein